MDSNCLLSRQPIYRSRVDVAAYEVRSQTEDTTDSVRAIFSMFNESGLDQLVGEHPGFINLTPQALSTGLWKSIPKSRVVLGYLQDFSPSDPEAGHLYDLVKQGYRLALSDTLCKESFDAMGDHAYAVKLDVTKYLPDQLEQRVHELRRFDSKIVAENVDTYDDLEFCKSLEFDYYQGNFLCKPAAPKAEIPVNRLAMIQLLSKLQQPQVDLADLERTISQDVALSYKLLKFSNSAAIALPREVSSVGHALRLVGVDRLKTWASVLLLSSVDDKPKELMNIALVRAHMCELLGGSLKEPKKESFMFAGLLSVLDALLDCPMDQVLTELPLTDEVREALLKRSGPIGQALRCTIAYERADWDDVQFYGLSPAVIRENYLEAIAWARQLMNGLSG